jgi:hypothetical protein
MSVSAFNKLFKPPKTTAEWAATYCKTHGQPLPCHRCKELEAFHQKRVLTLDANRAENGLRATAAAMWADVVESAGIDAKTKCVHGHYLAHDYCDVCRLAPVDPDYNPDAYRAEITKALKTAKKSLTGDEGRKDLRDLNQVVDIEIWKASRKYGDQMNESLAYTIAKNQAGQYLTERIEQQTVESTDAAGDAIHIPRFESMDQKPMDEDGNEMTTTAEIAVVNAPAQGAEFSPVQIDQLQALVATWRGQKRLVGDAMLRPGFNVRNVPGVPKSTAARVRQAVLKEFKAFISKRTYKIVGTNGQLRDI